MKTLVSLLFAFVLMVVIVPSGFGQNGQNQIGQGPQGGQPPLLPNPTENNSLLMKELQNSILHEDIEVGMLVLLEDGWAFIDNNKRIQNFGFEKEPKEYSTGFMGGFDKRQYSFIATLIKLTPEGWRYYGSGLDLSVSDLRYSKSVILVRSKKFKAE